MSSNNRLGLFLIIWLGDFFSTIGSGLTAFCLGVYAFQQTGQATSTALIVLATYLPAFLVRPFGGVLADRMDRSLLMILGNIGSALGIVLIFLILKQTNIYFNYIYFGIVLSSLFFALQNPAYKAAVSDYLDPELYAKASGLLQLSSAAQFLIAPLLGGFLMSLMNINSVLIIDIATFLFSAAAVIFVKNLKPIKPTQQKLKMSFKEEFIAGFKVILADRGVLTLVMLVSLLLFYVGLIQTLLTPMVLSFADARSLGFAQSTCAIGMLITSILISTVKRKKDNVSILSTSLILMGLFFAFIGIKSNIWAVIIPGFLFFTVIPYANSSIDVLIRKNIKNDTQGRAWSLISVMTYMGSMLAYAVSGILADKFFNPLLSSGGFLENSLGEIFGIGPGRGIALMFFVSGILVICVGVLIYRSKSIWGLEQGQYQDEVDHLATQISS